MTFLVTGGAGFVGSSLAVRLKRDRPGSRVVALDNLRRRGAELNVERLKAHGVEFLHGDVRVPEDLDVGGRIDCVIECSAEPSVQAGYAGSPAYVTHTNLVGALRCLEVARLHSADVVFLSTSRVYPIQTINRLAFVECPTRYELLDAQAVAGVSSAGLTEEFPLDGARSLYGATKLAAELIMREYLEMYDLRGVINRCGVIAGPWQMGKADQGVVALWSARHAFGRPLRYVGFGGDGKQVRDVLHVDDLYRLIDLELKDLDRLSGEVFNVGGGLAGSVSLLELTAICEELTGTRLPLERVPDTHLSDIRTYISDCGRVRLQTGWEPRIRPGEIVDDILRWITDNRARLEPILT